MLECLDAAAVRRWCAAGLAGLRRHQQEIDELNVFPVPDNDTGTNLVLTVAAARRAVLEADGVDDPAELLRHSARGALRGARGNSGAIVAQFLTGLAAGLPSGPAGGRIGGRELARALIRAAAAARAAVAEPVEGTILSVAASAAAAVAALDPAASGHLATVARAAAGAANRALADTPHQLPVLSRAGVVDAGGRGLCVLLDALAHAASGDPAAGVAGGDLATVPSMEPGPPTGDGLTGDAPTGAAPAADAGGAVPAAPTGQGHQGYEVQYLLDAPAAAAPGLARALAAIGGSVVVAGDAAARGDTQGGDARGAGTWKVHVHTGDVGAAIEAGIAAGRPYRIEVVALPPRPPDPRRASVVMASGPGLAEVFRAEGVAVVADPDPTPAGVVATIRATGAAQVVVVPDSVDAAAVAALAADTARAGGIQVGVVPTRSPVQALAALAVRDPARRFDDDLIAMAEAAGACRYAQVCTASRDAVTVVGLCRAGDVLALVDDEVNVIGHDLEKTCVDLLDRLLSGGGELVTLVSGAGVPDDLTDRLRAHLTRRWPFVEVQTYRGGQPEYPLLVGVE